jgi:clan AA aspartic protease
MIAGKVTADREAVVELQLAASARQVPQIRAVIDTGYNYYLTLPSHLITAYELPFAGHRRAALANGSHVILEVYLAAVVWHDRQRELLVVRADGAPLVGMSLLRGSRLTMDIVDDGDVVIDELR